MIYKKAQIEAPELSMYREFLESLSHFFESSQAGRRIAPGFRTQPSFNVQQKVERYFDAVDHHLNWLA
jgi:hypothetical protein